MNMCTKRNVKFRVYMYPNVQKVSRKQVFSCQRCFEYFSVVGRVISTKTVNVSDIWYNVNYVMMHFKPLIFIGWRKTGVKHNK